MKILLVAINACYNHTNLAVRSLSLYANKPNIIDFGEWTINQNESEILRGITEKKPDIILFSTYIWNAEMFQKIVPDVKKILPNCIIGAGGPETGFYANGYLDKLKDLDFIIHSEGEQTVKEITESYIESKSENKEFNSINFLIKIQQIKGIFLRNPQDSNKVIFTGERELLSDLSSLPFPYENLDDPDNRIYYYESSRGCPFSCAYCMSSLDKKVRFMPLKRVYSDIQLFLDANVKLVKFVDRTYNLQPDRYISIWRYILEHHNKKTMFHFEIEAEFLSEEAIDFLQNIPAGIMQFEIGVQSSNKETLKAVGRSDNIESLVKNIKRIPKTIHIHLDLIAGLPFENLDSFGKSFDFTIALEPNALQLGFLKVLHGTSMENYSKTNGWKWMENPPYETLYTPYLNYENILFLKDVEILVDAYWNSGKFCKTIKYIGRTIGYWNFFSSLAKTARTQGSFDVPRKEIYWFEYLSKLFNDNNNIQELLRFDFISTGKKGGFPTWYKHLYNKEDHRNALEKNGGLVNARLDFAYSDYEEFNINPFDIFPENTNGLFKVLFIYERRNSDIKNKQILLEDIL